VKTLRVSLLVVSISSASLFSFAAKIPTTVNDNVVTCGVNAKCSYKSMFGRSYKVMATPQFTVMVSISSEGAYTRADVSIANNSGSVQTISPEEFRVEVTAPKTKVLPYVSPARLQSLQVEVAPAAAPILSAAASASAAEPISVMVAAKAAEASGAVPMPVNIDELFATAKREQAMQAAAAQEDAQKPLAAAAVPANEVVRGRVYFEKDPKAKLANVVLPVAGLVFEFPYSVSF